MNRLKHIAKGAMGKAVLRTGVWDRLLQTWARRHRAIILTYHRVIEKWDRLLDYSQPGMVVTAETFDRQLVFLKKHFHIVPLSSFINFSPNTQHQTPDRPLCAITFDDGWRDNYEIAFPILQKHEVPATIFLTADFIGKDRVFWHTELIYLLLHGDLSLLTRSGPIFLSYPVPVCNYLMRLARFRQVPSAHDVDSFVETVKETCNESTIENLIRDMAYALGFHRPVFPRRRLFLDWDQVREMAEVGIEMGSHGSSHRILTRLKAEEAEEELVRSKAEIERCIGQRVHHFAFPDGAANRDLISLAGRAGYQMVCLCQTAPGGIPVGTFAVRRLGMHEGVSDRNNPFSEAHLSLWLLRAPRMRPALVPLQL